MSHWPICKPAMNRDGTAASHGRPGGTGSNRACLACRKIKMRCVVTPDDGSASGGRCQRCLRKSLECVFREHRRGRKPGSRISTNGRAVVAPLPDPEREARPTVTTAGPADAATVTCRDYTARQSTSSSSRGHSIPHAPENADWETGALQPSGLLEHAVSHGQFSLHNILNAADAAPAAPAVGPKPQNKSTLVIPADDPIKLGLVSLSEASCLFQSFMTHQNPFINQLDPRLHTLNYVRQRSSFLTSAILAVAAKGSNDPLYNRILEHAEDLLTTSFRQGHKSTETAQAVMVLTYWKKPEDNRAWISLGYAVRMGMELGWHRLRKYSSSDVAKLRSDEERLEARNIQRTWYILFVYDRSMSLQTGKPWMIERSDFIESIEAWCKDSLAAPSDRLMGAFVTLRLLSSEVFKLLGPRSAKNDAGQVHRLDSFLSIIKGRIDEWEAKWTQCVSPESCHPFQIHFYGSHLRLQLFSLPLQVVLSQKYSEIEFNLEALWISYSSAIEMLRLIRRYSPHARLAQDSVHVMTAYGARFLIKLLLSTPDSIAKEIENEVLETIELAAQALAQRISSPAEMSCCLQAAFLSKLVTNYVEKQRPQKQLSHGRQVRGATQSGGGQILNDTTQTSQPQQTTYGRRSTIGAGLSLHNPMEGLQPESQMAQTTPSTTTMVSPPNNDTGFEGGYNNSLSGHAGASGPFLDHNFTGLTAVFAEDMSWGNMFSNTGFDGQEGPMAFS